MCDWFVFETEFDDELLVVTVSVLFTEHLPQLKLQSNTQVIKMDKDRWHLPGFADDVCLLPFAGGVTDRRTSSKVLSAVGYAKFKAWSTVLNRALFWGLPCYLSFGMMIRVFQ